ANLEPRAASLLGAPGLPGARGLPLRVWHPRRRGRRGRWRGGVRGLAGGGGRRGVAGGDQAGDVVAVERDIVRHGRSMVDSCGVRHPHHQGDRGLPCQESQAGTVPVPLRAHRPHQRDRGPGRLGRGAVGQPALRNEPPPPRMEWNEVRKLVVIGCLQGVELGCNNKAIEFLPVSMKVMFHSMFVLFVMVSARAYGLERLDAPRLTAAVLILCGGVLQGWSVERRDAAGAASRSMEAQHLHGALLMLGAMLLGSQRWALIQIVMQRSPASSALGHLTKLQFVSRVLPVSGFVCLLLAVIWEQPAFAPSALAQPTLRSGVPGVALCIVLLTITELGVVRRTSAVALQVLATLHQIPIAFIGAAVFHETVGPLSLAGFGLCVLAALVYALARRREREEEACEGEAPGGQRAGSGPAGGELELREEGPQPLPDRAGPREGEDAEDGPFGAGGRLGAARAPGRHPDDLDPDEDGPFGAGP
ncbi:unnamed protein product, partial [Prorocentrum cordatum]